MPTTIDDIARMVEQRENSRVDFKSNLSEEVIKGLSTDIASFANNQGGKIVFGVERDSILRGLDLDGKERERISQEAANCTPVVNIDYEEVTDGSDRKFLVVYIPSSKILHSDKRHTFPYRVGDTTQYLDVAGLLMAFRQKGLISEETAEKIQSQTRAQVEEARTSLPRRTVEFLVEALTSKSLAVRLEALRDVLTLPYKYIILEEETLGSALSSLLKSTSAEEVNHVLDILRGIANIGSERERGRLHELVEVIFEIGSSSPFADTLRKALDVLLVAKEPRAVELLTYFVEKADDPVFQGLQLNNLLANAGYSGLKHLLRESMYRLVAEERDERTKKRATVVLETLRRGW